MVENIAQDSSGVLQEVFHFDLVYTHSFSDAGQIENGSPSPNVLMVCFVAPLLVVIRVPQGFFRPQSSNGFEHAGLFLHEVREGRYLLQQIAGNEFTFSGISVAASDAIKLRNIFDNFDIPMLLTKTKCSHRAMNDC